MSVSVNFHLQEGSSVRVHRWEDGHVTIAIHKADSNRAPSVTLYLPTVGAARPIGFQRQ